MAATPYNYSISGDFPQQKVNGDTLSQEIVASDPPITSAALDPAYNIRTKGDDCAIWFDDPLSAGDQTQLDAIVAAHQGNPPLAVRYHATASLVEERVIVTTNDWGYLASAVTSPDFFMSDLTKFIGKVVGAFKAIGAGAELRVLEDDDTKVLGSFAIPDSADEWTQMSFYSTALPSAGQHEYIIQGKLDGATSAEIRGTSMTILENVTGG
jgi:hypothetical protein